MAGENSMAHLLDLIELEELPNCLLEIGSAEEGWPPLSELDWESSRYMFLKPKRRPTLLRDRKSLLEPLWACVLLDSTFETDMIETIKHPDGPVPVVKNKNGLAVGRRPEEIITEESQWNKTEDNNLWAHLDKETTDRSIRKCPGRAEVDNWLRCETPKGKAAVTSSFITAGERTLSAASHKQSASPILYQTSLGGNQVDPEDGSVNISPSNQTDNYVAVSLDLDTATFASITGTNEPSPYNQKSENDVENNFVVGHQIISTIGSAWAKESSYDMSCNAESLWYILFASILVNFISWFNGLLLVGHKPRGMVARLLLCIAYVAIAFAVLAISGLQLPDEFRVWITGGACIVSLPAIIGYAMK